MTTTIYALGPEKDGLGVPIPKAIPIHQILKTDYVPLEESMEFMDALIEELASRWGLTEEDEIVWQRSVSMDDGGLPFGEYLNADLSDPEKFFIYCRLWIAWARLLELDTVFQESTEALSRDEVMAEFWAHGDADILAAMEKYLPAEFGDQNRSQIRMVVLDARDEYRRRKDKLETEGRDQLLKQEFLEDQHAVNVALTHVGREYIKSKIKFEVRSEKKWFGLLHSYRGVASLGGIEVVGDKWSNYVWAECDESDLTRQLYNKVAPIFLLARNLRE